MSSSLGHTQIYGAWLVFMVLTTRAGQGFSTELVPEDNNLLFVDTEKQNQAQRERERAAAYRWVEPIEATLDEVFFELGIGRP